MNTKHMLLSVLAVTSFMTQAMIDHIFSIPADECTEVKAITGDICIVPNALTRIENEEDQKYITKHLHNVLTIDNKKVSVQKGDYFVKMRAADRFDGDEKKARNQNWSSNKHPVLEKKFPTWFPVTALNGKNDGARLIMYIKNPKAGTEVRAKLVCTQRIHRYNSMDFPSMLAFLMKNAQGREEPEGMLTKEKLLSLKTANMRGFSPLMCAINYNKTEAVRFLLAQRASPNEVCNAETPIKLAIERNNVDIIELLVQHLADIKPHDFDVLIDENQGCTLLHHLASQNNAARSIRLILSYGARQDLADAQGKCPIHIATSCGYVENIESFLAFTDGGSKELLSVSATSASLDYAYDLLERHGWRKVVPRPAHPKANKEAQEEFKKNSLRL